MKLINFAPPRLVLFASGAMAWAKRAEKTYRTRYIAKKEKAGGVPMAEHSDILMGYNFRVSFLAGEFRASKVRNIEQSFEVEEVREGGLNSHVHTLIKPASQSKRLIFERGFCNKSDGLILKAMMGFRQDQPLIISIYDRQNKFIQRAYMVLGWTLIKWRLSDLDAQTNAVLLETLEAVYENLIGL